MAMAADNSPSDDIPLSPVHRCDPPLGLEEGEKSVPRGGGHPGALDGGWGWVVVASTTLMFLIISSLLNSFSVLYAAYVGYFDQSIGLVGMIIAVKLACLHLAGALGSQFVERYGCRLVSMIGFTVASLSILLGSFASSVPVLCTAYALAGCGLGVSYLCCTVCVQQYFDRYRSLASGISVTGFSLSTIILPPVTRWLLDVYDWRGTLVILAGLHLQGVVLSVLLRPPPAAPSPPRPPRCHRLVDFSLLLDPRYLLYGVGTLCSAIGIIAFLNHFVNRAVHVGIASHRAALLPSIYGGVSCAFRIVGGLVGNVPRVNRVVMYGLGILLAGVVSCLSALAHNFSTLAIAAVGIGISSGCLSSVQTPALVDLMGIDQITRSVGLLQLFNGAGALAATPFAGWLYDITHDYRVPYIVTGMIEAVGGILLILIPFVERRLHR